MTSQSSWKTRLSELDRLTIVKPSSPSAKRNTSLDREVGEQVRLNSIEPVSEPVESIEPSEYVF